MEVCSSYILGAVDFHNKVWLKLGAKPIFCSPEVEDQEVMRRNLLNYLRKNPAELEWSGIHLVIKSLRSLYPCEEILDKELNHKKLPTDKP